MAVAELDREALASIEEESPWKIIFKRFRKHKLALAGIVTIVLIALAVFFASWVAPYDPIRDIAKDENGQIIKNAPPSLEHLMGTDNIGRDIFSRLLYAGRISLWVAFIVTIISIIIGVLVGAFSGYYGGWIDDVIQRFVEFLITIPLLPLLLAFSALLRGPTIVPATLSLGGVIIYESALSFLGFGIQPPVPTWGNMLYEYQNEMWTQPAKVFFPGLMIFVCVLAFNYIGDGLRDAMDPRLKH